MSKFDVEYTEVVHVDDDDDDEFSSPRKPAKKISENNKKKCCTTGCVLCWCLIVILALLVLTLLLAALGGAFGYFWISNQVQRFTVTEPLYLPIVNVPREKLQIVEDRIGLFFDTLYAGEVPENPQLVVTADEMNGFVAQSDFLRGNFYLTMTDEDLLSVVMSLPAYNLPGGKDRYFVAHGSVSISPEDGIVTTIFDTQTKVKDLNDPILSGKLLVSENVDTHEVGVFLKSGEVLGWYAPDDFIKKEQDLLQYLCSDSPEERKVLDRIESVAFKDGKIVITARNKEDWGDDAF